MENDEQNSIYILTSLILGIILIIASFIPFLSLTIYKKNRTKEDQMLIQKLILKILLFLSFLIISFFNIFDIQNEIKEDYIIIHTLAFAIILLMICFLNLKINIEKYNKYLDSTFILNDCIYKKRYNFSYEIISFCFSTVCCLVSQYYLNIDELLDSNNFRDKENFNEFSIENSYTPFKKYYNKEIGLSRYNLKETEILYTNYTTFYLNNHSNQSYLLLIGKSYLIILNIIVYPISIVLIVLTLIYKIKQILTMNDICKYFKYNSFIQKEIRRKKRIEIFDMIFVLLNLFFIIISITLLVLIYYLNLNEIDIKKWSIYFKIMTLYFLLLNFKESLFVMFCISRSDFYKYILGNTFFSKAYSIFCPEVVEKPQILIESSVQYQIDNFYRLRHIDLNSVCNFMCNNFSISLDEVFLHLFDNTINIVFGTIINNLQNKIRNNKKNINDQIDFKVKAKIDERKKDANNPSFFNKINYIIADNDFEKIKENNLEKLSEQNEYFNFKLIKSPYYSEDEQKSDLDRKAYMSESSRVNQRFNANLNNLDKETDKKVNLLSETLVMKEGMNNQIKNDQNSIKSGNDYSLKEFRISQINNDFKDDRILRLINLNSEDEQASNIPADLNLKIQLKEYYESQIAELLELKGIEYTHLIKSFMSNYKNEHRDFFSLLCKNIREGLFQKQGNLTIKTADKLYSIEFLTSDNDNLNENDLQKRNLIYYMNYLKKNENSFLPLIVGFYKIKINKFKEIKVIITRNNLIEDVPTEKYNNWQLAKLTEKNKIEILSTSKDRQSLLVVDDNFIKNETKINLINYNDFKEKINSDLRLLSSIESSNYSLLIMCYEISNYPNPNSNTNDEVKYFIEKYGRMSSKSKDDFNYTNNNISVIHASSDHSGISLTFKYDLNLIRIENGYLATINESRFLIFFMFDNVFKKKNLFSKTYINFEKIIQDKIKQFNEE